MPNAKEAHKNNRSVCDWCKDPFGGARMRNEENLPCDFGAIEHFGGKRECQVCSRWRSEDHEGRWAHTCTIPRMPTDPFWKQYGQHTPDEYTVKRCQRCIDLGNKYCDVDEYLYMGCSACKRLGKREKTLNDEDNYCFLPDHPDRRLRHRAHVISTAAGSEWFRHMCRNCVPTSIKEATRLKRKHNRGGEWQGSADPDDDNPEALGCSWLASRSNQTKPCDQCVKAGLASTCLPNYVDDNQPKANGHTDDTVSRVSHSIPVSGLNDDAGDGDPNLAASAKVDHLLATTWRIPMTGPSRKALNGRVPLEIRDGLPRIICKACAETGAKCSVYLAGNGMSEACQPCTEQGINCIDPNENEWPIGSLAKVGFCHLGPFRKCDRCEEKGRNCDRQTPCDSCWKHGERKSCRPDGIVIDDDGNTKKFMVRYRNCYKDRLNPPPGPLYYLAMGYGAGGVDDPKTGDKLEDWVGPLDMTYAHMPPNRNPMFPEKKLAGKAQAERSAEYKSRPLPPGRPPSMSWKPAYDITVEDIRLMILSEWPDAKPPNEWRAKAPDWARGDADERKEARKAAARERINTRRRETTAKRTAPTEAPSPDRRPKRLRQGGEAEAASDIEAPGSPNQDALQSVNEAGGSEYEEVVLTPSQQFKSSLSLPVLGPIIVRRKKQKQQPEQPGSPPEVSSDLQVLVGPQLRHSPYPAPQSPQNEPQVEQQQVEWQAQAGLQPDITPVQPIFVGPPPHASHPFWPDINTPQPVHQQHVPYATLQQFDLAEFDPWQGMIAPSLSTEQPPTYAGENIRENQESFADLLADASQGFRWQGPDVPPMLDTLQQPSTGASRPVQPAQHFSRDPKLTPGLQPEHQKMPTPDRETCLPKPPPVESFYDPETGWIMGLHKATDQWRPIWYVSPQGREGNVSSWLLEPRHAVTLQKTDMFIVWKSGQIMEREQLGTEVRNKPIGVTVENAAHATTKTPVHQYGYVAEDDEEEARNAPDPDLNPPSLDPKLLAAGEGLLGDNLPSRQPSEGDSDMLSLFGSDPRSRSDSEKSASASPEANRNQSPAQPRRLS